MAQVTNRSDTTAITNHIDSEFISKALHLAVKTPYTYEAIANRIMLGPGVSRTYTHVLRSHLAAASAVSETDEVAATALADTQNQISVSLVASAVLLSDQARGASVLGPEAQARDALNRAVDAVRLYIDDAFHGESANMSNSIGSNATTHDLTNWNTMLATFAAQAKNVQNVVFVGHPDQVRDLGEDVLTSGAGMMANDAASSLFQGATSGYRMGYRFSIGGVPVVSTDEIPAADTTGWGGYITSIGMDGAIGLAEKVGVTAEIWREPKRFSTWMIARSDLGVGILDQNRCLEVISKT